MRRLGPIFLLLLSVSGCRFDQKNIDRFVFEKFGGTLMTQPLNVTLKELHLDNGSLLGQNVVVAGSVVATGQHLTYLVISDETARMLVVLTELNHRIPFDQEKGPNEMIRILGRVERGKKGLPFILAESATLDAKSG